MTRWWPNSPTGCGRLRTLICAAELAKTQAAGLRAGQAFARAYVRAKRAAGVADFDDLIAWTRRLFEQPGMGEWVRYKLDQRTDHILVDEAQDTNARPMGDRRRAGRRIFLRQSGGRRTLAHLVHGRRLQAGDLRLPGHRPQGI